MVFSLSVLWWIRIRGLWKLSDGRDRLRGRLGLVLIGRATLSTSLIQFSVDGWGCVPSLLFDLRPNYGGGKEDNGDPLQKPSDLLHLACWCVVKNVYCSSSTSPLSWTDLLLINPFHVLRLPHSFKVCALPLPSYFIPHAPPPDFTPILLLEAEGWCPSYVTASRLSRGVHSACQGVKISGLRCGGPRGGAVSDFSQFGLESLHNHHLIEELL